MTPRDQLTRHGGRDFAAKIERKRPGIKIVGADEHSRGGNAPGVSVEWEDGHVEVVTVFPTGGDVQEHRIGGTIVTAPSIQERGQVDDVTPIASNGTPARARPVEWGSSRALEAAA